MRRRYIETEIERDRERERKYKRINFNEKLLGCAAARKTQRDTVRHRETRTGTQRDAGDKQRHNSR